MTGNLLIDLAISFGGIAFLLGISVLLGAWRSPALTVDLAKGRLRFDEPDFIATDWLVDPASGVALAASEDGDLALVFRMGDNFATRRAAKSEFHLTNQGPQMVLRVPGLARRVTLHAGNDEKAGHWIGALNKEV